MLQNTLFVVMRLDKGAWVGALYFETYRFRKTTHEKKHQTSDRKKTRHKYSYGNKPRLNFKELVGQNTTITSFQVSRLKFDVSIGFFLCGLLLSIAIRLGGNFRVGLFPRVKTWICSCKFTYNC